MAQAGSIKTISGSVSAQTSTGQVRELNIGDIIYENELIVTSDGAKITIELDNGKTINLSENAQIFIDESVIGVVDAHDAVVSEVESLQAALEAGEDITDAEDATALGDEDDSYDYDLAYYAGDQTRGEVGTLQVPTEYGSAEEVIPIVTGEIEEQIIPPVSVSAISVTVDETDIDTSNTATGTITVDYGTPTGTLALSAPGATWDAGSSTLTYQQDGTDIWQIVVNQGTGAYEFTQLAAFDHGPDANDHNALEQFAVTVIATNEDDNSATTTFTAGIYDDGPTVEVTLNTDGELALGTVMTDETTDLGNTMTASAAAVNITALTGEDNEGATTNVALTIVSAASGLTTTDGKAITLVQGTTDNEVLGRYDSDGDTVLDTTAFSVSVTDAGVLSVTQLASLTHPDSPDNYDEAVDLTGKL